MESERDQAKVSEPLICPNLCESKRRASTLVAYGGGEERADFGIRAQEARRSASGCPSSSDYWLPHCSVFSQGSGANLHPSSLGADPCSSEVAEETPVPLHATQGSCSPAANSAV